MQYNPNDLSPRERYKLLNSTVVPRPIAWVSTVSQDGINNLAPFSYANVVSVTPPLLVFSAGTVAGAKAGVRRPKDTLQNTLDTGEFVYNVVSYATAEAMNLSATEIEPEEDEFEFAGVTPAPSVLVNAPRVAESLVNYECRLEHTYSPQDGGSTLVIGRIVLMHIDDSILLENYRINTDALDPVGRMAGSNYAFTREQFAIDRLPSRRS